MTKMFRMSLRLGLLIIAFVQVGWAQRDERTINSWQPEKYDIDLRLNKDLSAIIATATITGRVLIADTRVLTFQFGKLDVDGVTIDGSMAHFRIREGFIDVDLSSPLPASRDFRAEIRYHGRPSDGLILGNDRDGQPSAVGDNWPDRVHNWIPCIDHPSAKARVSFTITAPQREFAIANGQLLSRRENSDSTVTWSYDEAQPIPPYCMVIAVGQFQTADIRANPKVYYAVPGSYRGAASFFAPASDMVGYFSKVVSAYPYEKLALIVGATQFGGMENSSAIVFPSQFLSTGARDRTTPRFRVPERIETTTAHEIAHQWFGDSVTEKTWADLWLSEGFATYFAGLFLEEYEGKDEFHRYMNREAQQYFTFEKQNSIPVHDEQTPELMKLLNANNYQKGAWILHMLRSRLGDEAFFNGIRNYYQQFAGRNADSRDLEHSLEKAYGHSLSDFFDRWVFEAGHPIYKATWKWTPTRKGGEVTIDLRQTQQAAIFTDPLTLGFVIDGNRIMKVLLPKGRTATFKYTFASEPRNIVLDPNGELLQESSVRRL